MMVGHRGREEEPPRTMRWVGKFAIVLTCIHSFLPVGEFSIEMLDRR
jgi:hypothetical protein